MPELPDFAQEPETTFDVKGASFSENRAYRYALFRRWGLGPTMVNFIMLNPSTADESEDDPTIRRCVGFARLWDFDCVQVTNLYAIRTPSPERLRDWYQEGKDVVGSNNDEYLMRIARASQKVVCAWGAAMAFDKRGEVVRDMLTKAGVELWCLGRTKDGHPKHPLYLANDTELDFY